MIITRCSAAGVIERFYMQAEVPDWNIEDIPPMDLEERVATEKETPESLYAKIQYLAPTVDEFIVKKGVGHYFCDHATLNSLPEFKWYQIFNMVGADLVTKTKRAKR